MIQWAAELRQAVCTQLTGIIEARTQGLPDPTYWNVFDYPMIIRAGATLYSAYAQRVLPAEIDLAFDTQGRILINGQPDVLQQLSLGLRLYANLSPVIDGSVKTGAKVTILFLSDFPSEGSGAPIFSVYGRAVFSFSRTDGTTVSETNQADQFSISVAGAAAASVGNNSIGLNGSFTLTASSQALAVTATSKFFIKVGDTTIYEQSASGALLITNDGIAALISVGYGSTADTSSKGFSFTGFFTVALNTGANPVAQINGHTVDLEAGPYFRLSIGGDPTDPDSQASLQLMLGGENGFRLTGSFVLTVSSEGLEVSATTTLTAIAAGKTLLSVDAVGALLVTESGIAARIDLTMKPVSSPAFTLGDGSFTLMVNTTHGAVSTINNLTVDLPSGPYIYLAVSGSLRVPAADLSLDGVFSISVSTRGLEIFTNATLTFGKSGSFFTLNALGVLIINGDGASGDIDVSLKFGSSLAEVFGNPEIAARIVFNTTGKDQNVIIPAAFLPLLGQEVAARLTESPDGFGRMMYVVYAGAPLLDGTRAAAGSYIVVQFSAALTLGGFWDMTGNFRLAAGTDSFELAADAQLDVGPLGSLHATGYLSITNAGVVCRLAMSGGMATEGFSLSAAMYFEVNTTGSPVTVGVTTVQPGYRIYFNGKASFVGFCEASVTGFVSIDATGLQLYLDGSFIIGPLSFQAAAYVGVFDTGIVMDASVSFKTNILSLFVFDFSGRVQLNTTDAAVSGFNRPDGYVYFENASGARVPNCPKVFLSRREGCGKPSVVHQAERAHNGVCCEWRLADNDTG